VVVWTAYHIYIYTHKRARIRAHTHTKDVNNLCSLHGRLIEIQFYIF
jgi:hypothetical protein